MQPIYRLSLPTRGAWIEIVVGGCSGRWKEASLPTRGVWIEINSSREVGASPGVAPYSGSVD